MKYASEKAVITPQYPVFMAGFASRTLLELVTGCSDRLQEGELQLAVGSTAISVSRRVVSGGEVLWAPNYDAQIDNDLAVFKLVDANGVLKTILFSHGCHPTAVQNLKCASRSTRVVWRERREAKIAITDRGGFCLLYTRSARRLFSGRRGRPVASLSISAPSPPF